MTPSLPYGAMVKAGIGHCMVIADFDFETFSPAGFVWDAHTNKWKAPWKAPKKGLKAVGAAVYVEHPDAEVLHLAYDLKDGKGKRRWKPGEPQPLDLFAHLAEGKLIEAWNSAFERWVWDKVCRPKYGWPELPFEQVRCAMAKSRASTLPGKLGLAAKVLGLNEQKDTRGETLLKVFSVPQDPTNKNGLVTRIRPEDRPEEFEELRQYGDQDIVTEAAASLKVPDLSPTELAYWQMDQRINRRGMAVDTEAVDACLDILEQAYPKYNMRLAELTYGRVTEATKLTAMKKWMADEFGIKPKKFNEAAITELLSGDLPAPVREVLTIRLMVGSAAVKKIYSLKRRVSSDGRIHDMYTYYGSRTGRASGAGEDGPGVQGQNLPNSGPNVYECQDMNCLQWYGMHLAECPFCRCAERKEYEWNPGAVETTLQLVGFRSLELLEHIFANAIEVIAGSLRGLLVADKDRDLVCSDFSAIEGVVTAFISGEEWMMEVYRTHGKIYEATASQITGIPFEEFIRYKKETGSHHPMRKKIGKPGALGSGFGGWIGAWKRFGADKYLSDDEIIDGLKKWRAKSPNIVEMWGGQFRDFGRKPELFGLEGMVVAAILHPGKEFSYRGITYFVEGDILYCRLLSGRHLVYREPRLAPSERNQGYYSIQFKGFNSNPSKGAMGWITMELYGGIIFQNVVQATARDIMFAGMLNLEQNGFPIVLHTHDEPCAEIPKIIGDSRPVIERFEQLLTDPAVRPWCPDWPVKAAGGWSGFRYRKD